MGLFEGSAEEFWFFVEFFEEHDVLEVAAVDVDEHGEEDAAHEVVRGCREELVVLCGEEICAEEERAVEDDEEEVFYRVCSRADVSAEGGVELVGFDFDVFVVFFFAERLPFER